MKKILVAVMLITATGVFAQTKTLTEAERHVLINGGTEVPYSSPLLKEHRDGTYNCKVCDTPLFSGGDKFDSCGWPSFDDDLGNVVRIKDTSHGMTRTEIRCGVCDSHLGHEFLGEGLTPKNARHCVNGIAVNFVPSK